MYVYIFKVRFSATVMEMTLCIIMIENSNMKAVIAIRVMYIRKRIISNTNFLCN
jgi:hypothetical protein